MRTNISFLWGFADNKNTDGIPTESNWKPGALKKETSVHELHISYLRLVQEKYHTDNIRVRLHFKLRKFDALYPKIFKNPSEVDMTRFIECTPEWITADASEFLETDGLSVIVTTKIEGQAWSWEEQYDEKGYPKLGNIYDIKYKKGMWLPAMACNVTPKTCTFRIINLKHTTEPISEKKLKSSVLQRGTNTNGYIKRRSKSEHLYLYPPYPKPVIVKNENVKLSTNMEVIPLMLDTKVSWLNCRTSSGGDDLTDCLANDKLYRDVTFVLKGGIIVEAHGSVLAVRSQVFGKMLTSKMLEGDTGRIELLDVDPKTMNIFVNGLYNIDIPDNIDPQHWEAVFWLCDKYQVDFLIPKLIKKLKGMSHEEIFPRLFNIFRKIPLLEGFFSNHKNEFIIDVLKIPPKKRTQAMQDFLLEAHLF